MTPEFLNKCYQNHLNIDLKSIHSETNSYSQYHSKNGLKLELDDLDLEKYPIKFTDITEEQFKLVALESKNFLVSNSAFYPCSRVYENIYGHRWVEVLIVPKGEPINILNINSSVKYNFLALKLFDYLKSYEDLIMFDKIYCHTFSNNEWFSQTGRMQFLVRSRAQPSEIFKAFQTLKLFNPFQLSLFSISNDLTIDIEDIQNILINTNHIPISIPYITGPSFKVEISKSTNEIINTKDFHDFIGSLTDDEIRQFFELDFLEESLNLSNIYPDFNLDILGIKIIERWIESGYKGNVSKYIRDRLEACKISEKLIREYYKNLKRNLRSVENKIRTDKGFNIVGSLYNESLLYKLVQDAFPHYTIISQYSPEWLGKQRFDIFVKELHTAIEFNGRQHYAPVSYFGGEEGFLKTIERDKIKRTKCKTNGCRLIEIRYDEDLNEAVVKLKGEVQ